MDQAEGPHAVSTDDLAPMRGRRQEDHLGLLAVACAGLLPVVLVNDLYWGTWAPKAALCLVLLLPGLVVLARLLLAGSRTARFAASFLAWATLATVLSDKPALSLVGTANWGTGLLFLAATAAAWALGSYASDRRRQQLLGAVIGAVVANGAVAWVQTRVDPERPRGLLGNAAFLGGFAAAGLLLLAWRFARDRRSWWWLVPISVVAGAIQLSGGRAAAVLGALATLVALRGATWMRRGAVMVAVVAGVGLAPLGAMSDVVASERTATARVVSSNDTRFAVWRAGAGALTERPLVGWGPARFPAATAPRYDAVAAQEGVVLKDAHNWIVEHAVTTGVVGLVLLLGWLGTAARGASGPLAGFALIVGASTLVQPMHVALTPVAMMALGAAGTAGVLREGSPAASPRRGWNVAAATGTAVGLVAAAVLIVGQVYLQQGVQSDSLAHVRRAAALSPAWPEVELLAASVEAAYGLTVGEPYRSRTLERTRRAVRRDPADPSLWAELGSVELQWGTDERAASAFERGLAADPWDLGNLAGRVTLARRTGDLATLAESCRRLRVLEHATPGCRSSRD